MEWNLPLVVRKKTLTAQLWNLRHPVKFSGAFCSLVFVQPISIPCDVNEFGKSLHATLPHCSSIFFPLPSEAEGRWYRLRGGIVWQSEETGGGTTSETWQNYLSCTQDITPACLALSRLSTPQERKEAYRWTWPRADPLSGKLWSADGWFWGSASHLLAFFGSTTNPHVVPHLFRFHRRLVVVLTLFAQRKTDSLCGITCSVQLLLILAHVEFCPMCFLSRCAHSQWCCVLRGTTLFCVAVFTVNK